MFLLADGENIYFIYNGKTIIYKKPRLTSWQESRNLEFSRIYYDFNFDFTCNEMDVLDKEISLKENWMEEMTVKEVLDVLNNKMNQREELNENNS